MFLFRHQFQLTPEEENALCDICIFLVSIYVEAWFSAPSAAKAPYLDFCVLSKLFEYQTVDCDISRVALKKLQNHLWYLSPEAVALAFFYSSLSFESKQRMIDALNYKSESSNKNVKRLQIQIDKLPEIFKKGIEQFVSSTTKAFFKRFELDDQFLQTEPSTWSENRSFIKALELVKKLRVVNDTAERSIQLMDEYNKLFTKNEEQTQYVLHIVKEYRQKFPDHKKQTLVRNQQFK